MYFDTITKTMAKNKKIEVAGTEISVISQKQNDYISLTDMAKSQLQDVIIIKWLSLKSTIEYIGEWEALYNPNFNYTEFGTIRNAAGSNNFVLSVKNWIEATNAIGVTAKAGRQRLKEEENDRLKLEWNLQRTLAKVNYQIHTDAIYI